MIKDSGFVIIGNCFSFAWIVSFKIFSLYNWISFFIDSNCSWIESSLKRIYSFLFDKISNWDCETKLLCLEIFLSSIILNDSWFIITGEYFALERILSIWLWIWMISFFSFWIFVSLLFLLWVSLSSFSIFCSLFIFKFCFPNTWNVPFFSIIHLFLSFFIFPSLFFIIITFWVILYFWDFSLIELSKFISTNCSIS